MSWQANEWLNEGRIEELYGSKQVDKFLNEQINWQVNHWWFQKVTRQFEFSFIILGTIDTPSLRERLASTGDYDTARKRYEERQKNGRLGKPSEIAALAVYLASDEAAFVTGQKFVIDGGWSM